MKQRTYLAVDLKSFYASVECVERGLDPLTTNLLVADESRTQKTICLAVSPSLKAYGVPGRPRLFEAVEKISQVNALRRCLAPGKEFRGRSWDKTELDRDKSLAVDYIVAPPRMACYMRHSARVFETYLKYVAPEDIHVYSIDEVLMDITPYLKNSGLTAWEFGRKIIQDVLETSGITATGGIGSNLYLCKVAMDIVAKHAQPDRYGVRMAQMDEMSYRRLLWEHRPLTDFWRVGRGYARKLEAHGLMTMGDVARCSLENEDLLYKMFGVNAELLIDHAWGWEPCTMKEIKAYRPSTSSICSGQVLHCAYSFDKARLVAREMADLLSYDLVEKGLVTDQLVLTVGYDIENLTDPVIRAGYRGEITTDAYGRKVPKHAHGTGNLPRKTASTSLITEELVGIFDRVVDPGLRVRRINITANHLIPESTLPRDEGPGQMNFFADFLEDQRKKEEEDQRLEREKRRQQAVLGIRRKYGKNAIFKGMNLEEGATARDRNRQIGGHQA